MSKELSLDELRSNYRGSMIAFGILTAVSIAYIVLTNYSPWITLAFAAAWGAVAVRDWRRWQKALAAPTVSGADEEAWYWNGTHWVPMKLVSLEKEGEDAEADQAPDRPAGD